MEVTKTIRVSTALSIVGTIKGSDPLNSSHTLSASEE